MKFNATIAALAALVLTSLSSAVLACPGEKAADEGKQMTPAPQQPKT